MLKLNIGSANQTYPGWENIDLHVPSGYDNLVKRVDVTQGLPYGDSSIGLLVCQHCFDHWNPILDGIPLLAECHRVLTPGGIARFSLMDMRKIMAAYPDNMNIFAQYQPKSYRAIKSPSLKLAVFLMGDMGHKQSQGYYGHWGVLDFDAFKELAEDAGWTRIVEMPFGKSHSKTIERETKDMYENHTMFIELIK